MISILKIFISFSLFLSSCLLSVSVVAQSKKGSNLIYVDKQGVIRFTKTKKEAAFFGVNYTVPFAYGYRSVKRTGKEIEKAIEDDVYHLARLGLDAFRVHVWDWEITDSLGNLLENEHLRLFDYLLHKLKERNIKALITPIAFWGNGYPERDEKNNSFSSVYGKGPSVVKEEAIRAQENYMKQFFTHINPFTKLSYKDDPGVIATEINNEPHHSGPKERTTEYVNRLAIAIRSTGWTKPVFYNISESPTYADAVAKANVDGHSFQWYPTGLVANRTLQGNLLPNVDRYVIPFDTIPEFKNRARMVYEFDAGDVLQSNMYPAMVRSFREAGFQWATQFAYDPMATAYANTEYQTHYLNLAYTPSKAISLLIASKAFHTLPRGKSYGVYPVDSTFDVFRVSYLNSLSEMNSAEEFYYSNTTTTNPVSISKLKHIAGVGNSPIVKYNGSGAYFLDKISDGVWRLEVMPDAVHIRDPFDRASPSKEVTRIEWSTQQMQLSLPDLGSDFNVTAVNAGNTYSTNSSGNSFNLTPGTYLIKSKSKANSTIPTQTKVGALSLTEFVAPLSSNKEVYVTHTPYQNVTAGNPFTISTKIAGVSPTSKITAEIRNSSNKWKTVTLAPAEANTFNAEVPADIVTPGVIGYRIIIQNEANEFSVFPGNHKGDPYAWDAYTTDLWQTYVAATNSVIELFNPGIDRTKINFYNPEWRNNTLEYISGEVPENLVMRLSSLKPAQTKSLGFDLFVKDKLASRRPELAAMKSLVVNAKTTSSVAIMMKVTLIDVNGVAYASNISIDNKTGRYEIPLAALKVDSALLLPRPYPGFQALTFKAASVANFDISNIDRIQVTYAPVVSESNLASIVELASVFLKK